MRVLDKCLVKVWLGRLVSISKGWFNRDVDMKGFFVEFVFNYIWRLGVMVYISWMKENVVV